MAILRSWPVWVVMIAQWGGIWGFFTLLTQAPTYFHSIHGWGVNMTGLLSGIPHLCRIVFAIALSALMDYLLKRQKLSRTNVRRLAGSIANIAQGIFVIGLAVSGCNTMAAVIFFNLATAMYGAVSCGPLALFIDIRSVLGN